MTSREKIDLIANTDPFELIDKIRVQTIEECARVAEEYETHAPGTAWIMEGIAAAIRALKDKP